MVGKSSALVGLTGAARPECHLLDSIQRRRALVGFPFRPRTRAPAVRCEP
jgi:hypothetical protein